MDSDSPAFCPECDRVYFDKWEVDYYGCPAVRRRCRNGHMWDEAKGDPVWSGELTEVSEPKEPSYTRRVEHIEMYTCNTCGAEAKHSAKYVEHEAGCPGGM